MDVKYSDTRMLMLRFGKLRFYVPEELHYIPCATFFAGEYDFLKPGKGDVVIDAGANIGDFTYKVARKSKIVLAIEPEENNIHYLKMNMGGTRNVIIVSKGISNETKITSFKGSGVSGKVREYGEKTITVDTLDNICEEYNLEPTILKMDIEGFESRALEGMAHSLTTIRRVVIEVHDKINEIKCENILKENSFNVRYQTKRTIILRTIKNTFRHPISFLRYDLQNNYYGAKTILKYPVSLQTNIPSCNYGTGMKLLEAWK